MSSDIDYCLDCGIPCSEGGHEAYCVICAAKRAEMYRFMKYQADLQVMAKNSEYVLDI